MSAYTVTISISELGRTFLETAYAGKKADVSGSAYDTMVARDTDEALLLGYISDAADELCTMFADCSPCRDVDNDTDLIFKFPATWDYLQEASLVESVNSYLTSVATARWMRHVKSGEEAKYEQDAKDALNRIYKIVFKRTRPKRPQYECNCEECL